MPLVRLDTEEDPVPNLAPMIDVILVLTIFFMCATKFSTDERRFDLDLPKAGMAASPADGRPEVIEVESSGGLRFAGERIEAAALVERLSAARTARPELSVTIRGERAVPHGRMAEVYEACRAAGVSRVAIAVQARSESRTR
ncbi:MAG: biopolymer transporter ExbD [Planctomycetes bacterium]|nr:biopolymer transporter ExbD [Planctomycetota bacterium]